MELSREPAPFSDLVGRPVCDQGGRALGRVFEARAHWERDGSIVIDELLVGRRGLWRRLRGPGEDDRSQDARRSLMAASATTRRKRAKRSGSKREPASSCMISSASKGGRAGR